MFPSEKSSIKTVLQVGTIFRMPVNLLCSITLTAIIVLCRTAVLSPSLAAKPQAAACSLPTSRMREGIQRVKAGKLVG